MMMPGVIQGGLLGVVLLCAWRHPCVSFIGSLASVWVTIPVVVAS